MWRRKPQPRAPRNHTALVELPTVKDIVTPASVPSSLSLPPISKEKFLSLYSCTVKKNRVLSKRPRGDGDGSTGSGDGAQERDEGLPKQPRRTIRSGVVQSERRVQDAAAAEEEKETTAAMGQNKDPTAGETLEQSSQEWSMPTDTKIALEMMCSQFPKIDKASSVRPFVLRSQLYSSVSDRTLVDRELEGLKFERAVRIFKLSTGQDDYAVMFMADYLAQIEAGKKRLASKHAQEEMAVFDWFVKHVIPSHLDAGIAHTKLISLLCEGGSVKDSHISLLMNAGLLTRQLIDETAYWFAIPNAGFLLKSVTSGRKEILSFLSRRKYREMLQVPLERRPLQYSMLGMRFHIRDLLGSGHIHVILSPSGPLVRLVHD